MEHTVTHIVARNGGLYAQLATQLHASGRRALRFVALSSRPGRDFMASLSPRNREQIEIIRGQFEGRIGFTEDRRDSYPLERPFCLSSVYPLGTVDLDLEAAAVSRTSPTGAEIAISSMNSRATLMRMRSALAA